MKRINDKSAAAFSARLTGFCLVFVAVCSSALGQALRPDLRIEVDALNETFVGGTFDVTMRIFNEGTEEVFAGESITWAVGINGPDGQAIASLSRSGQILTGLPINQSTPDNRIGFRMPWSQAAQWANNAQWTVVTNVITPRDANASNNSATTSFSLVIPDITLNNVLGPATAVPGQNVSVTGTVANVGRVQTQPNVYFRVEARMLQNGTTMDTQSIVLPNQNAADPFPFDSGDTIDFTIDNLTVPADGNGTYDIIVTADAGSPDVLIEHTENNNQATVQFSTSATSDLRVVDGSFFSDDGTLQGMAPAHFRFSARNFGTGPVRAGDAFSATIALSRDRNGIDPDDFILRQFNLGGSGLGLDLRPNETVTLDWIQRMPDNFEGDFYVVATLGGQTFASESTPSISLRSNNTGDTNSLTDQRNAWSGRPSYDQTGQYVAFESLNGGVVNIFLLNTATGTETQVTRSFSATAANGSSFAPSVSADGSFVAFHSYASNLVPGDTNEHADVFLFDRVGDRIYRLSTSVNFGNADRGSYYPAINGDGTAVAFESLARNLTEPPPTNPDMNIYVWDQDSNTINKLEPITSSGDYASFDAAISGDGNRVAFTSHATNFAVSNQPASTTEDTNDYSDVFLWERNSSKVYLANVTMLEGKRTSGGPSLEPAISGDGKVIAYRSSAKNLVSEKGISVIVIEDAGVGYTRTPTISISDNKGPGSGAEAVASINSYGEILSVTVLASGTNYIEPEVTVIPHPADTGPVRLPVLEARLTHPDGDVYRVEVNSLIDGQPDTNRVSESTPSVKDDNGSSVGGDMGSREPTLNYDGSLVAYATQASNLLDANITRQDRRVFPNATFRMARARAVIGGPIGEIEIQNSGQGYQDGQLRIEDLSGSGSDALALYHVDNYGRIANITIVNAGNNYDYSQTIVSVDNPRAGTGFLPGTIRWPDTTGIGRDRVGGGTIQRIEMDDEGLGYTPETTLTQGPIVIIDGDGADLDNDGNSDAKINPDRIYLGPKGEIFLEQRINLQVQSTAGLDGATLTISDHLKTETFTFDAFSSKVTGNVIGTSGLSVIGLRDSIADALNISWNNDDNGTTLYEGLKVTEQTLGADHLIVSTLRGRVTSGNPSSLKATILSNMLIGGTGYTRATPIIGPDPVVFGYSEINTNLTTSALANGRPALLIQKDQGTDDIYLYDHSRTPDKNERISRSKFGFPVNYSPSGTTSMPSNRFPTMSGNGRFIAFSSDASGTGGLLFGETNQSPLDTNNHRDVYVHDRKTEAIKTTSAVTVVLSDPDPTDPSRNKFLLDAEIDISFTASTTQGTVENVRVFINNLEGDATQDFPLPGTFSREGRFLFKWTPDRPGTYYVSVLATNNLGETSLVSHLSTAVVEVTSDPQGLVPIAILEEPVPGGVGGDTYPDYSVDSELFVNVRAYDPDGHLEYIRFYYNDELLGEPEYRFGDIYAFRWHVTTAEDFVFRVEVKDNDGNVVRTESLAGTNANNSSPRPEVLMDQVSMTSDGVKLRAIAKGNSSGGFFGGSGVSRVQFFANGVTLSRIVSGLAILNSDYEAYETVWRPEEPGVYQFHAMAVGDVGDFGDHHVISNPITFEIRPEHVQSEVKPNSPPTIKLLQPGEHTKNIGRAHAVLHETRDPYDPHFGQIASIVMDDVGADYVEPPKVLIAGGGGEGATATAHLLDEGVVSAVTIIDGGSGYSDDVQLTVDGNGSGSGLVMSPTVISGVLTNIPVKEGGGGYSVNDLVKIFDLKNSATKGTGALAGLEVDENGSVKGIKIYSGGHNYDSHYLRVAIESGENAAGFDADEANATVIDGVISSVEIIEFGTGYGPSTVSAQDDAQDENGSAFRAEIKAEDIRNGGISVTLDANGSGYKELPKVILMAGTHSSSDYPFQFVLGSRVLLEAEAEDVDGFVKEVKFYGNGEPLGARPNGNLSGLKIVNAGAGFNAPPAITIDGGGGSGATATVSVDKNTSVITGVNLTNPGTGYTTAPTVVVNPPGGAVIEAELDTTVINNARQIPGTSQFILEWVPEAPGVYEIGVEAIDDGMRSAFHSSGHHVVVIPPTPSKPPVVQLLSPTNGESLTSTSEARLYAMASDPDGKLEWVRFYVNGEPVGELMEAVQGRGQRNYPYSVAWSPTMVDEPSVYSVVAVGMDSSHNSVMSSISTVSTTHGSGELPEVSLVYPVKNAEIEIEWNGTQIVPTLVHGGIGYSSDPHVVISGVSGAQATATVQTDSRKPNFGQVIEVNVTDHGEKSVDDSNLTIELLGGFPLLQPSGETAEAVVSRSRNPGGGWGPWTARVTAGGSGYKSAPTVIIQGAGTGMTATAAIGGDAVTSVNITNQGTGYAAGTGVVFQGGFAFNEIPLTVETDDVDGVVTSVTFYENGTMIPGGNDGFEPFEAMWSPGSAGIYELYAVARDNHGNRKVSSVVRREVFESTPPTFEFEPLRFAELSLEGLIDANGSMTTGDIPAGNIVFPGQGYHSSPNISFIDESGSSAVGAVSISSGKVDKITILQGGTGYSSNAEARFLGGLNTSIEPIIANLGEAVFIGIQAEDPDTLINDSAFQVFVNGNEDPALQVGGTYPHYSLLWDPPSLGLFDLRVHGAAVDGLSARTKSISINVVRGEIPSVEMIVPRTRKHEEAGGESPEYTLGTQVHFVFDASDPDGEIASLQIFSGATQIGQYSLAGAGGGGGVTKDGNTTRYSFSWSPVLPGTHEITALAIDNTGQEKFSWPVSLEIVDPASVGGNQPPEVTLTFPNSGMTITSTTTARIYATGRDADGALEGVNFYVNGELMASQEISYQETQPVQHVYAVDWDINSSDIYSLHAEISDNSGNGAMSSPITVTSTIGTADMPTVTLQSLNDVHLINDSLFLTATVRDNVSLSFGIQSVSFLVNGVSVDTGGTPDTSSPYFTTWTPTKPGVYEIIAYARDDEGNMIFSNPELVVVVAETSEVLAFTSINRWLSGQVRKEVTITQLSKRNRQSGFRRASVSKTSIRGLSTSFMSELVAGQKIKFAQGDKTTATYTVTKVVSDDELEIAETLTSEDYDFLSNRSNVQVIEVYRAGSWIFLAVDQEVNTPNVTGVDFYVDGVNVASDTTWPFSTGFIPATDGNYSIRAVATDKNGIQKLVDKRIEVLPQEGHLPDGAFITIPQLTRYGATTRASQLVALPQIVDLDDGVNRVEFYLNGKLYRVDEEAPFYCIFSPDSSTSLFETDRGWELTMVAVDNSDNRISLTDIGTVAGSVELPVAVMTNPAPGEEFPAGQMLDISVEVRGFNLPRLVGPNATTGNNPNAGLKPRQMALYANGEEIGMANETSFGSGRFSYTWSVKSEIAGSDGKVDLFGVMVMQDETVTGLTFTPAIVSEPVTITLTERNPLGSTASAVAQFYKDLLFYEPAEEEVNLALDVIGNGIPGEYIFNDPSFFQWAADLVARQAFKNLADAVAGYHITIGAWPPQGEMMDALQTYSAIPNYGTDGSGDSDGDGYSSNQEALFGTSDTNATMFPNNAFRLGSYLDNIYSGLTFLRRHGGMQPLNGSNSLITYEKNRRDFVTLLYGNKHGVEPTIQQQVQGSYRIQVFDPQSQTAQKAQQQQMMQQMMMYSMFGGNAFGGNQGGRGNQGNNNIMQALLGGLVNPNQNQAQTTPKYKNGDGAVNFTAYMVLEEQIDNMDLLWNAPDKRNDYLTAALMLALWQDNVDRLDEGEINKYSGKSMASQIQAMMKDYRYLSRFAVSISADAQAHKTLKEWKYLPWLGYYNDRSFPWIFVHRQDDEGKGIGLGWVYVQAPDPTSIWLYIPDIGWMWTKDTLLENLPTYEPTENETWNLVPLYNATSGQWMYYVPDHPTSGKVFYNFEKATFDEPPW